MKIQESDFNKGFVRVVVTNDIDLWHLENIIESGDFVTAKTLRTIILQREERKEKIKKKFVTLKIRVENVNYQKYMKKLRVKGKIVECPKDVQKGSYHTIEIGRDSRILIEKRKWKKEQIDRLKKASYAVEFLKGTKLLKEFFIHVNKNDGLAAYGFDRIKTAAEMGAVKVVLIPEERIREKRMEGLIEEIEKRGGEIKLVSKGNSLGKKFQKIYDVGAVLRFRIS